MKHILFILKKPAARSLVFLSTFFAIILTAAASAPVTGPISFASGPTFLTDSVQPNVILTVDDSGSMAWGYLPDPIASLNNTHRACSSTYNKVYYNPKVSYIPAVQYNGSNLFSSANETSFNHAYNDGFTAYINNYNAGTGLTTTNNDPNVDGRPVDLSSHFRVYWDDFFAGPTYAACGTGSSNPTAAYYYYYNTALASVSGCPSTPDPTNDACYTQVIVGVNPPPAGSYASTPAGDAVNFAYWYSYYRTHVLVAKTSSTRVFSQAGLPDNNIRFAYQSINQCSSGLGIAPTANCPGSYVQPLSSVGGATSTRAVFFNWLYGWPASGGTPMLDAVDRMGVYTKMTSGGGNGKYEPWAQTPPSFTFNFSGAVNGTTGGNIGKEYSCRQNFGVIFTDGEWNVGYGGGNSAVLKNADSTALTLPDNSVPYPSSYTPNNPYQLIYPDNNGGATDAANSPSKSDNITLADIAFYYWVHDARPDLTMNVPPYWSYVASTPGNVNIPASYAAQDYWNPNNNPATWHHLTLFPVAIAGAGQFNYDQQTNGTCYNTLLTSGASPETVCPNLSTPSALKGTPSLPFVGAPNPTLITWAGWPPASASGPLGNLDDLWHAAVNSRGAYYSAQNPRQIMAAFSNVLNSISARSGTSAGLAVTSGTLNSGTHIYEVKFNGLGWAGQVFSFSICDGVNVTTVCPAGTPQGAVAQSSDWDGGFVINTQCYLSDYKYSGVCGTSTATNGRSIFTYNPSSKKGVPFSWGNLSGPSTTVGTQQYNLDITPGGGSDTLGSDRLDYLRGSSANEGAGVGDGFRSRSCYSGTNLIACKKNKGRLGDVVDSTPIYVGVPPYNYPDTLESQPYSTFKSQYANRLPMLYVGANDGMLHGLEATSGLSTSGAERMAYVPNLVYPNLSQLTSTTYVHQFFVDGSPSAGDVFYNGAWHTVLVGGLRTGGNGYFALDITDPTGSVNSGLGFFDTNAANVSLWEFSDQDMGYTFSHPVIAKMRNGKWAAIVGNGYDNTTFGSTTGHANLYILFIGGGIGGNWVTGSASASYIKLDTGVGSIAVPNGIGDVAAVDVDGDNMIEYVYAGDLQGNLWKFDLTNTDPSKWTAPTRIFTAMDGATPTPNPQPITTAPQIGPHPAGLPGYMVYFGTGKYLEPNDNNITTSTTQTIYGIWDSGISTPPTRSSLLQQTISLGPTVNGNNTRLTTNNPIVWRNPPGVSASSTYLGWYDDLPTQGEVQVTDAVLRNGNVILTTLIPSSDPCTVGGSGWLMEVSATNGGQPAATFDLNGDGSVDANDLVSDGLGHMVAAEGKQITGGGGSAPVILTGPGSSGVSPGVGGGCTEYKYVTTATGTIVANQEQCASVNQRQSWIQLR